MSALSTVYSELPVATTLVFTASCDGDLFGSDSTRSKHDLGSATILSTTTFCNMSKPVGRRLFPPY
jgi:hypothetical protein